MKQKYKDVEAPKPDNPLKLEKPVTVEAKATSGARESESPGIVHEAQHTVAAGLTESPHIQQPIVHEVQHTVAAGKTESPPAKESVSSQPSPQGDSRFDVRGTVHDDKNTNPMLSSERQPCPTYSVTLRVAGHQALDTWGANVPCNLDGFGEKLHGAGQLP